jgi:hypothetical protein
MGSFATWDERPRLEYGQSQGRGWPEQVHRCPVEERGVEGPRRRDAVNPLRGSSATLRRLRRDCASSARHIAHHVLLVRDAARNAAIAHQKDMVANGHRRAKPSRVAEFLRSGLPSHGDVRVKGAWLHELISVAPSLLRHPRSEPVRAIRSFPHQINLTYGRRTRRLTPKSRLRRVKAQGDETILNVGS